MGLRGENALAIEWQVGRGTDAVGGPQRVERGHQASTLDGGFFETEGLGGVARGLEEGFIVGGPKDFGQTGLVLQDPVCRGQGPRGFIEAFARDILLPDDDDHAGEQTLENAEDIAHGSVVAESGECRTVKNHFPLDSTLG